MTTPKFVIVSGSWLQACGMGAKSRRFRVLAMQDYGPGRRMFDVETADGRAWTVWEVRLISDAHFLAERLGHIRQAADARAERIARRYRYSWSEFPELRAFFERHRTYANRAWMLGFWIAEMQRPDRKPFRSAFDARDLYA